MRLIYTDEAGTSAKEPVCVVAAVIVDGDRQWRPLEQEVRRIVSERVPERLQANFVLHATEVFSGGKRIKRDEWAFEDRLDFLKEILCLPFIHDAPIALGVEFKIDWSAILDLNSLKFPGTRSLNSNQFSHLKAFNACMERADLFIRKYLDGREIGSVIAEDVPEMKRFLTEFGLLHRNPDMKFKMSSDLLRSNKVEEALGLPPQPTEYRIDHIVDVPHFVTKGKAPLLQLADACAFAFRHCLSKSVHGNDLVMAMLGPRQGPTFVDDPVWFSGCGSSLYNTEAYWSDEHRKDNALKQAALSMRLGKVD